MIIVVANFSSPHPPSPAGVHSAAKVHLWTVSATGCMYCSQWAMWCTVIWYSTRYCVTLQKVMMGCSRRMYCVSCVVLLLLLHVLRGVGRQWLSSSPSLRRSIPSQWAGGGGAGRSSCEGGKEQAPAHMKSHKITRGGLILHHVGAHVSATQLFLSSSVIWWAARTGLRGAWPALVSSSSTLSSHEGTSFYLG